VFVVVATTIGETMIQVIAATFAGGVFKPDQQPVVAEGTRVRLAVEPLDEDSDERCREQAWANLKQLWQASTFDSRGDRLSRDQLQERH
jgi:predicted DNA-binding antitoxin AbrB/MazE fold protein